MFENNFRKIKIEEIKIDLEFEKLPPQFRISIERIKNCLKLTRGLTPKLPIVRQGEWVGEEVEKYQYAVVHGHFTAYAARLLYEENSEFNFIYCFVLDKQEAHIFENLQELQHGISLFQS